MAKIKRRKKRKRKNAGNKSAGIIVLLLLLFILFAVLFIYKALFAPVFTEIPEPPGEVSVTEPAPSLPPNLLDAACFGTENGYKTYLSGNTEAALGIDISSHQGWIDWYAVADSGIDFVILRAGYRGYKSGEINRDEYLEYNLETATDAGLDIGLYFFSQAITPEEAQEEAKKLLKYIKGYEIAYPIYFDWEPVEDTTARTATISSSELTACAKAFCETIESAGYTPGVYFNLSLAMDYYYLYELKDYEFWLAEYTDIPTFPWEFQTWQYSCTGTVPGIETVVDMNLCFTPYGS